jgi:hypothetical protein
MKKLFLIGAGVLGEVLLLLVLNEFEPVIGEGRMLVNLIFISLALWIFLGQFIVPPVNGKDQEGKWVGSLGIHLHGLGLYFLATLIIAFLGNVISLWPSRWQMYAHLIIIAVFLFYNFLNRSANEYVGEVYHEEEMKKHSVKSLKQIVSSVNMNVSQLDNIPTNVIQQLNKAEEEIKDFVPLFSSEALQLEEKIGNELLNIESNLTHPQDDAQDIADILRLVHTLIRKRQILTD